MIVGGDEGEVISNKAEIEALGLDSWRLHAIKTCVVHPLFDFDNDRDMIGIQFILAYVDFDETEVVRLTPIGDMAGDCQELTIVGEIDQIKATYDRESQSVNSIKIIKDGKSKTYGNGGVLYNNWMFDDDKILMGLHGKVVGRKIIELGTISLFIDPTSLCSSDGYEGL